MNTLGTTHGQSTALFQGSASLTHTPTLDPLTTVFHACEEAIVPETQAYPLDDQGGYSLFAHPAMETRDEDVEMDTGIPN